MADNFTLEIEQRVLTNGSYIDTIVALCAEKNICEYDMADMLHPVIIEKLKQEYISKHHFPDMKNDTSLESFFA